MPRPKGVGMPKPKKEKLQDVNDDSQPSIMDAVIDADPSKGSAARPAGGAEPSPECQQEKELPRGAPFPSTTETTPPPPLTLSDVHPYVRFKAAVVHWPSAWHRCTVSS